ncbi:hypothetical protein DCCM_4371 [Desulfocucumis palustris]|uniref:Uncharacterized protein n=1 Tax=Desulfocucumis palustris TaxID=1898651 RepID=A0A2L2XG70_9FIRM|nr:hypothetical protein [Desulfocucumis palustris]GBF35248.1 hypothetical protein DCCM_4371 [Desulfocucumis palustris]
MRQERTVPCRTLPAPQEEPGDLRLEELMKQKERLEDLIAERQAVSAS